MEKWVLDVTRCKVEIVEMHSCMLLLLIGSAKTNMYIPLKGKIMKFLTSFLFYCIDLHFFQIIV